MQSGGTFGSWHTRCMWMGDFSADRLASPTRQPRISTLRRQGGGPHLLHPHPSSGEGTVRLVRREVHSAFHLNQVTATRSGQLPCPRRVPLVFRGDGRWHQEITNGTGVVYTVHIYIYIALASQCRERCHTAIHGVLVLQSDLT